MNKNVLKELTDQLFQLEKIEQLRKSLSQENTNSQKHGAQNQDILNILSLLQSQMTAAGEITPEQGELAKLNSEQKNMNTKKTASGFSSESPTIDVEELLSQYNKKNNNFFAKKSRKHIQDYLVKNIQAMSEDELRSIAELVAGVEIAAIEEYEQQKKHENGLKDANSAAIEKLTTVSSESTAATLPVNKIFTRDEIRSMNTKQFKENEAVILDQMRKGLIK